MTTIYCRKPIEVLLCGKLHEEQIAIPQMNFEEIPVDFGDNYLWKYMDIHKFLYLIREKKIYFARLDDLEDLNEGVSERNLRIQFETQGIINIPESNLNRELYPTEESKQDLRSQSKMAQNIANRDAAISQKQQFASCWFLGERESYAMWNLYSNHESVAVRFKPGDLLDRVAKYVQNNVSHSFIETIVCSKVEYLPLFPPEYDGNKIKNPAQSYVGLRKDTSYIGENEYRMLAIKSSNLPDHSSFELELDRFFEMDFKWSAFLGMISYSVYLVHVPFGGRLLMLTQMFNQSEWTKTVLIVI